MARAGVLRWVVAVVVVSLVALLLPPQAVSAAPAAAPTTDVIHMVVDRSGSMSGTKLADAKSGVIALANAAGDSTALGLRSYEGGCTQPPTPEVPIALGNVTAVTAAAQALTAGGGTPTSVALQLAIDEISQFQTFGDKVIVLVSDGENGCAPTVCQVATQAVNAGVDLRMFTVGLYVTPAAAQDLTCAAEVTGGTHFTSFDELLEVLDSMVLAPNETFAGQPWGHFVPGMHPTQYYEADPVSTATGNFLLQRDDVTTHGGRGVPATFTRTYNSHNATITGPLGFGWTHTWAIGIQDVGDGLLDVTWGDGRVDRYAPRVEDPGTFARPPDVAHTLTRTTSGYTLHIDDTDDALRFDDAGRLVSITDRSDITATLTYTAGLLTAVTDASGRTVAFGHDTTGRIATVTDTLGQVWSYRYDAAGNLVEAENPAGETWTYTYDSGHRLVSITDPEGGAVVTNTYDGTSGRVATQLDGEGGLWQYEYLDGVTEVTDPTGVRYTAHRDGNYRTVAIIDEDGHETRWSYDRASNLRGTSDPSGALSRFEYDSDGNLTAALDPRGLRTEFTYDTEGNLVASTNPAGGVTTHDYDALGRLVRTTAPTGEVVEITYRPDGLVNTISDRNGGTIQHHYDAQGLHVGTTDPLGRSVTFSRRADGLPIATVDPAGATTTRTFDAANRLTSVTDPNGSTTALDYDGRDNVVAQTDPNGNTTTHTYDRRGLRTSTTDPLGRTSTQSYDAAGRPVASTDARGVTVTRIYDHLGRLVRVSAPGEDDTVITYDAFNRRHSTTDGTGTITHTYDKSGRVVAEHHSRGNATVRYRWDVLGGPAAIEMDRAGTLVAATAYRYDASGRPVEVIDAAGGTTTLDYDELGRRERLVHANGTNTTYTYDAAGQLTHIHNLPPAYTDLVGDTEGPLQNAIDTVSALQDLTSQIGAAENLDAVATVGTGLQTLVTNLLNGGIVGLPALLALISDMADVTDDTAEALDTLADDETVAELERLVAELGQLAHSLPATAGTDPLTDLVEDLAALAESATGSIVGLRNELSTFTRLTADAFRLVRALLSGGEGADEMEAAAEEIGALIGQLPEDLSQLEIVIADTIEVLIDLLGAAGALQSSHSYTYDLNGRLAASTRSFVGLGDELLSFQNSYSYDPGGRLIATSTTDLAVATFGNATYGYDPSGNRTSVTMGVFPTLTATFDAAGQRVADTLGTYTYDAGGNMTSRTLTGDTSSPITYAWDAYNRLTAIDDGNTLVRHRYDHSGRRTRTEVTDPADQTKATDSYYAGWDLLFSDGPGIDGVIGDVAYTTLGGMVLNALFTPSVSEVDLSVESNRRVGIALRTHFHADRTGNVTEVSDTFGNAVVRNAYGPWGETASLPSALDPTGGALLEHGFGGGIGVRNTPSAGLLDMRHRTYDPALGQFLSRDPLEQLTRQAYTYASNDPVNLIDPFGLCSIAGVRIGFMSNSDGGCKGADLIEDYADDASAWAGGIAMGCTMVAWTGVGAGCAGIFGTASLALSSLHTGVVCLDHGFNADCGWSALQTGISFTGYQGSRSVRNWADARGRFLRPIGGAFARGIDFQVLLFNTGISLERTGWYDK